MACFSRSLGTLVGSSILSVIPFCKSSCRGDWRPCKTKSRYIVDSSQSHNTTPLHHRHPSSRNQTCADSISRPTCLPWRIFKPLKWYQNGWQYHRWLLSKTRSWDRSLFVTTKMLIHCLLHSVTMSPIYLPSVRKSQTTKAAWMRIHYSLPLSILRPPTDST